jgi:membrane-anchored glycerophosphoryl diester phosphodiesterase (GDPDase)
VMGVAEGASRIGQTRRARNSWEVTMKRKLLLAVVWIALACGIAAIITFPPESVLTAEFHR